MAGQQFRAQLSCSGAVISCRRACTTGLWDCYWYRATFQEEPTSYWTPMLVHHTCHTQDNYLTLREQDDVAMTAHCTCTCSSSAHCANHASHADFINCAWTIWRIIFPGIWWVSLVHAQCRWTNLLRRKTARVWLGCSSRRHQSRVTCGGMWS